MKMLEDNRQPAWKEGNWSGAPRYIHQLTLPLFSLQVEPEMEFVKVGTTAPTHGARFSNVTKVSCSTSLDTMIYHP